MAEKRTGWKGKRAVGKTIREAIAGDRGWGPGLRLRGERSRVQFGDSQQDGMEEDGEGKEGVEGRRSEDESLPASVCQEFGGPGVIC